MSFEYTFNTAFHGDSWSLPSTLTNIYGFSYT